MFMIVLVLVVGAQLSLRYSGELLVLQHQLTRPLRGTLQLDMPTLRTVQWIHQGWRLQS